jgi:hypothetical protein
MEILEKLKKKCKLREVGEGDLPPGKVGPPVHESVEKTRQEALLPL